MTGKLLRSTAIVGANTVVSRVLGFVRDMVIARVFGASPATDAFFVAFRIPNLLRRQFAEGAFSAAFVPVLTEYKAQRTEDDVRHLLQVSAGTLGGILALVSVLGMLAAPGLVLLFAPGFSGDAVQFDLTTQLLRICFPYLLFITLTALAGAALNSYGQFAVPAFTPVFLNLAMIGAALFLAPRFDQPVVALAVGIFVAGVMQLLFQLPALHALGLLRRPRWGWRDSGVRRIARLMLPALLGSSVAQINLLVGTVVASFLASGSVTWLYYADRLVEFPLGVFGIALATVILPHLSQQHVVRAPQDFSHTLDWGLRLTLVIALPATVGLVLLAGPILATLFMYGEFTRHDVNMTALSLACYAVGLLGFILVKILAPGFYARHDTRTPVRIGVIAIGVNMVLTLAFVVPLEVLNIPGSHAGLALATAIAAYVNAGLLLLYLRRTGVYVPRRGWRRLHLQLLLANIAMGLLLWFGVPQMEAWVQWTSGARVAALGTWIAVAMLVYLSVLKLTGVDFAGLLRPKRIEHGTDSRSA